MPNKYSHGLVFSQQQSWGINNNHSPSSLKPPSSRNSKSHTRSAESSISTLSGYSAQNAVIADYIHLEPDTEQSSSSACASPTHIARPSFNSAFSDACQFESTSSERSRPPSDRLRLESPTGIRIEDLPLPPRRLEPRLSERPHCDLSPSHYPDVDSSPQERIRLVEPSSLATRNPRPSLHHKNSSVETQIYAPRKTASPPPTQGVQDSISVEPSQPYSAPPVKHERQHVYSTNSPNTSRPPTSTGHRQERFSPETWRGYIPSPTRDRRQSFVQMTQALASPQAVDDGLPHSRRGAENSPLSPSARNFQDYFSLEKHGSRSASTAPADRQKDARSPLPTESQHGRGRPSLDIRRVKPPLQTQLHRHRPSFESHQFSSESQPKATLQSVHGRRQSVDSQRRLGHQDQPSLGPRRFSFDQSIKQILQSRSQSINSKTGKDLQSRPSSSQQLSWEQFVHESENIREPLIDSQTYSSHMLSFYPRRPSSRQDSLADAQRYTPKKTSLGHMPRSRQNQRSNPQDTSASQYRILLPTGQGTYNNVSIETHGFPPKRPPSPPATPDSDKSFSLTPPAAESSRTRPCPPPRSARRSLSHQQSMLRSTNSSVLDLPSEPPRPKTSSAVDDPATSRKAAALHSPTFSISTRTSSINATRSTPSVTFSDFSDTMTSPRPVPLSPSGNEAFLDDADLTPLPSEIDYAVLPYENPNAGPAIFRATQLRLNRPTSPRDENSNARPAVLRATQLGIPTSQDEPVSSRASSFDSAAPPPIGLHRRISLRTAKPPQPKSPKKESKTSLLSILRPTPIPKAILYSQTPQGKPPASVSVSRTGIPSIPSLFPRYRGQFPPPPRTRETGSKSSLEPKASAPRRSPAHVDAAEKRRSWLKSDDIDKSERASRLEKQREFERILKAL